MMIILIFLMLGSALLMIVGYTGSNNSLLTFGAVSLFYNFILFYTVGKVKEHDYYIKEITKRNDYSRRL